MKIIITLICFIMKILYFLCATVGSLLVLPCRVVSALCCVGGMIILFDSGVTNWQDYLPYLLLGLGLRFVPVFVTIYIGKLVLWIELNVRNI